MQNPPNSALPVKIPNPKIDGKTKARQTKIAALIARGDSVKEVARKVNMSESRIYHLLSENDSFVNVEINRILNELFAVTDRYLINLYSKALQKLDAMLSSSDEEKQYRAMDRIIKMFFARTAKNSTIQQYFCAHPQSQQLGFSIDEVILSRRKERGLDKSPDHKDSSDSSPDDDSLDNSPPNARPADTSSPNTPSPNVSSPEYNAFVESIIK